MRELRVDMFSTVDGYGASNPPDAPYWGYGAPGLLEWIHGQLAEEHVMLMGATTYQQMSEIVANAEDPTFPRMAELPKLVFSKTLTPPLTWANTTIVDEPVETAMPELKAMADGLPMRTIGSPSLVRSFFRLGLVDRVQVMVLSDDPRCHRCGPGLRRSTRPRPAPHRDQRDRCSSRPARLSRVRSSRTCPDPSHHVTQSVGQSSNLTLSDPWVARWSQHHPRPASSAAQVTSGREGGTSSRPSFSGLADQGVIVARTVRHRMTRDAPK